MADLRTFQTATESADQVITKRPGTSPAGIEDGEGNDATSQIVDSGSNANGDWVRFADGTQICTRTASLDYSFKSSSTFRYRMDGGFAIGFAFSFEVAQPAISFNFVDGLTASAENARTTCRPYLIKDSNSQGWSMGGANTISYTDTVKLFAIGRWK